MEQNRKYMQLMHNIECDGQKLVETLSHACSVHATKTGQAKADSLLSVYDKF